MVQVVAITVSTPTPQQATTEGIPATASEDLHTVNVVTDEPPQLPGAEVIAAQDAQMISHVISNIIASNGNTAETLVDRPERRNSYLAKANSAPFSPLTSAYYACLASTTQVLCLPTGTYYFGSYSYGKIASRQFSLNQVRYLVGPPGFSVKVTGSGNPGQTLEDVTYNSNITSGVALSTTIASRVNTKIHIVFDQWAHIEVSVPFDVPCVCGYEGANYQFDSNCFGPGGPTKIEGITISSLVFHGGTVLNGIWQFANGSLQTFFISSNQPNLPRFLGLPGLDEPPGQIYSIAVIATGV